MARKKEIQYVGKQEVKLQREPKTVVVERELDRILQSKGRLTTELILAAAKNARSALHQYFEWEDSEAAHKYRLEQAYHLMRATKYVCLLNESKPEPPKVITSSPGKASSVRKFIRSAAGGFTGRAQALSEQESRALFVEQKLSALVGWCRSVVDVEELAGLRMTIEDRIEEFRRPQAAE